MTVYVPGLRKTRNLMAHVVMWILMNAEDLNTSDDLYLAAQEIRTAGLEVDHLCWCAGCINPDHLEGPLTPKQNISRRRWFRAFVPRYSHYPLLGEQDGE